MLEGQRIRLLPARRDLSQDVVVAEALEKMGTYESTVAVLDEHACADGLGLFAGVEPDVAHDRQFLGRRRLAKDAQHAGL